MPAKILVVDDNPNMRKTLGAMLRESGYETALAESGSKALEKIAQQDISLLILDLNLPDMNGLEILKQTHQKDAEIKSIILTGFATQENAIEAINLGAFAFMQKPLNPDQFLLTVQRALQLTEILQAKRISEESLQILFEKTTNPILILDHKGNYLNGNIAACNFFECSLKELQTKSIRDYLPPSTKYTKALEVLRHLWEVGGVMEAEYNVNGHSKFIRLSITPGKWQEQKVVYGLGTDITDFIITQQILREKDEFFQTVLDSLPVGIAMNSVTPGVFFDYMNENFPKFYRTTREALLHPDAFWKTVYEDPEFRKQIKDRVEQDCASGDPQRMFWQNIKIKRKRQDPFYISARNTPVEKDNLMISTVWDVTEQVRNEKRLQESEQRFKWLYENAPIPYHILDADGNITDVNQRWCDVLGYERREVIGQQIFNFIVEDEREAAKQSFEKKKGSRQRFVEGHQRKYLTLSGEIKIFRTYDFFNVDSNGKILSVQTTIEDITSQKKAEDELRLNLERLRSLTDILQYRAQNEQEFLDYALEEAIQLTQSKIGYIYFYDEKKQEFTLNTWSKDVMKECSIQDAKIIYPLKETGLWGEAVRQRKTIMVNDFTAPNPLLKGYPKGHAHLEKFLTVPILSESEIVAVIGVANKTADYEESDALQLSLLMESVWKATEHRRAVTALQESEVRQSSLINATQDLVILKDADFRHIVVNQAAERFFGKSKEEILGKTDFELMDEAGALRCRETDEQALRSNQLVINEEKAGERFFESRKFPVPLGSQSGVGGFIRDITENKYHQAQVLLKTKQITVLNEMGLALAQALDLNEIMRQAHFHLKRITDCPTFAVSLVNFDKQVLESFYVRWDEKEIDISQMPTRPINEKTKTGRSGAINSGKPVILHNLPEYLEKANLDKIIGYTTPPQTAIFIPMIVNQQVIGLLELLSHQKDAYSEEIGEILSTGANQIGLAIENSRFLQTQQLQTKALNAAANAIVITDVKGNIEWINPAFAKLTGYSFEESRNRNLRELVQSGMQDGKFYQKLWSTILKGEVWKGTLINRRKDGSQYAEEMTITPLTSEDGSIRRFIAIKQDVSEREQRERALTVVANVSSALRSARTREEMLPVILDQLIEQLDVEAALLAIHHPVGDEMVIELGRGLWQQASGERIPPGKGLARWVMDGDQAYLSNDIKSEKRIYKPELFIQCRSSAGVPLSAENQKFGALFIGSKRELQERDVRLLRSVADIAANALHRSALHEETRQKVYQLNALRTIEQTINTSLDLRVTFSVILKQANDLLGSQALAVFLSRPHTMWLEQAANYGFMGKEIEELRLHIGRGLAGQSILERCILSSEDTPEPFESSSDQRIFAAEGFQSFFSAPLLVKGDVKGVLLVFQRQSFTADREWLEILQTLATQTAIAIDNHEMFDRLQRSTANLTVAYNETIEGWAKALELRDQETEGHSQRVMQLTIRLADEFGIHNEDLQHLVRGALLHDIGKMGIPDAILNKPGPLSDEEMQLVRRHPTYAYEMLASIKYLQPALEIPYCHHEKWDGTGYPRGLKGEEIPLSARIFAVVDVWDALTSDRPYRKAWPRKKALEYIRQEAGRHFDPQVVNVFLERVQPQLPHSEIE